MLPYRLKMVLYCFVRRKRVSQINVLCTIYEKEHISKHKVKVAAYCCFFLSMSALLHFRTPPRVRVRATVKLSAAFFHDESSITIGGYESAIAPPCLGNLTQSKLIC